jgi:lycopene beta-cyclase
MVFDIAVIGAGCAGWQLLYQFSLDPAWKSKTILLLEEKEFPDIYPTWCFWTKEEHPLEFLSTKIWNNISVATPTGILNKPITPYRYVYIEGKIFYEYFNNTFLKQHENIKLKKPVKVGQVTLASNAIFTIETNQGNYSAHKVYSSKNFNQGDRKDFLQLSQNFKGWKVTFTNPVLDDQRALFMDFRNSKGNPFEFMYILPFSNREGLIEWTTFIGEHQKEPDYEVRIQEYIHQYFPKEPYQILQKEHGEIPMTNFPFSQVENNGIIHIGTAAGMIKSSTGYTFNRITKDSIQLSKGQIQRSNSTLKFRYYDTLMMRIMRDDPEKALKIFYSLFTKNSFVDILKFLDEETSILEDFHIFARLPMMPLILAIFKK